MCGIVGVWAREDNVPGHLLHSLFAFNEKRGRDGYGFHIYNIRQRRPIMTVKYPVTYSKAPAILDTRLYRGEILLGICRAKPETEVETDPDNLDNTLQPIIKDAYCVVHNGSINTYFDKCYEDMNTLIDSECIINQYVKYGFPEFVTKIAGGFAFLLLDSNKRMLIIGVNHMPLYHCYVRGVGYFVSSVREALDFVIDYYYKTKRDSMNVWESWYHTEVSSHTIRQIDLESGMVSVFKFEPLYLLPNKTIGGRILS